MVSQFLFLPSVMLSGIMFPAEMLPETIRVIGNVLPATWGYQLMNSSSMDISNIIPLLIIIGVATGISAWRIKKL